VTALAGCWSWGSRLDPLGATDRMLKAQAVYAPARPASLRVADCALGRRLFPTLPEDAFDAGPATAAGGRWTIVADLRLDNRGDLAETLGVPSAQAARLSDCGLLALAVERWEERAVERLLGDFAFAAFDRERERLILARDFAGQRPLFFHRASGFFAFASMAKGLHALPEVPRAADRGAVAHFLALRPEEGSATFFAGVERVPPGAVCLVTRSAVELRRWWSPPKASLRLKDPRDYGEAVRASLDAAVTARLRGAGARVASHLSGGLDSSAVAATAARQLAPHGRVVAFTSVPAEAPASGGDPRRFLDEGPHAAAVAALYPNIDHVLVRTAGRSPLATLDRSFFLYERPIANLSNLVWADAILDEARSRGLSVLLTGQLGNLSFSHSGSERLPALLRRGRLLTLAREAMALRRHGAPLSGTLGQAFGPFVPERLWQAVQRRRGRRDTLRDISILSPAAIDAVDAAEPGGVYRRRPSADPLAARLVALRHADPGGYNKGVLGGWGIDLRDPTGDRALVELCLSIPIDQYLRGGRTRALARDAFADRLPPLVLEETRKGRQAADWHEGMAPARADAAAEVEAMLRLPDPHGLLDTERLRRLLENWPEEGWQDPAVEQGYGLALLRGLSGGHFVRKASGGN
jgi:asparagine synthase (glutamine-hydrolysing)